MVYVWSTPTFFFYALVNVRPSIRIFNPFINRPQVLGFFYNKIIRFRPFSLKRKNILLYMKKAKLIFCYMSVKA